MNYDQPTMEPTVNERDVVFFDKRINELTYGDVIHFKCWDKDYGDSVSDMSRIVGLPGDRIDFDGDSLIVNGRKNNYIFKKYVTRGNFNYEEYEEILPNGVKVPLYFLSADFPFVAKNSISGRVPADSYFVLNDNRNMMELDSRHYGCIPRKNILGRMTLIIPMYYKTPSEMYQ